MEGLKGYTVDDWHDANNGHSRGVASQHLPSEQFVKKHSEKMKSVSKANKTDTFKVKPFDSYVEKQSKLDGWLGK